MGTQQITIEELGKKIKQRKPGGEQFSDLEVGQKALEKDPNLKQFIKESPKTFTQRVGDIYQEQGKALTDVYNKAGEQYQQGGLLNKVKAVGGALAQTLGRGATLAAGALGEGISSLIPDAIEKPVQEIIGGAIQKTPIPQAVEKAKEFEKQHPIIGGVVRTGLGAVELASTLEGGSAIGKSIKSGIAKTGSVVGDLSGAIKTGRQGLTNLGEVALEKAPQRIKSAIEPALERRRVNFGQQQLEKDVIESAIPQVKKAYELGVDINDANRLKNTIIENPNIKSKVFKMLEEAKKSTKGLTAEPEMIIGKEAFSQFKKIDQARKEAGKVLSEYASAIPDEKLAGSYQTIFDRMKAVRGLEGLELRSTAEGFDLDFAKTALSRNKSAQKQIINDFREAVRRKAQGKHLFRQELFNDLNLKNATRVKKIESLEDKAIEAIRQGLADVLDASNDQYRRLNQEYAQLENALKSTRRVLGQAFEGSEDVSASKLAQVVRRTTSVANADARKVLEDLQNALKLLGVSDSINLVTLQEVLNILDKYYDIAKGTGLQKQVGLGVTKEIPSSIKGALSKFIEKGVQKGIGPIGITDTTKQRAIEDLINSLIK